MATNQEHECSLDCDQWKIYAAGGYRIVKMLEDYYERYEKLPNKHELPENEIEFAQKCKLVLSKYRSGSQNGSSIIDLFPKSIENKSSEDKSDQRSAEDEIERQLKKQTQLTSRFIKNVVLVAPYNNIGDRTYQGHCGHFLHVSNSETDPAKIPIDIQIDYWYRIVKSCTSANPTTKMVLDRYSKYKHTGDEEKQFTQAEFDILHKEFIKCDCSTPRIGVKINSKEELLNSLTLLGPGGQGKNLKKSEMVNNPIFPRLNKITDAAPQTQVIIDNVTFTLDKLGKITSNSKDWKPFIIPDTAKVDYWALMIGVGKFVVVAGYAAETGTNYYLVLLPSNGKFIKKTILGLPYRKYSKLFEAHC